MDIPLLLIFFLTWAFARYYEDNLQRKKIACVVGIVVAVLSQLVVYVGHHGAAVR